MERYIVISFVFFAVALEASEKQLPSLPARSVSDSEFLSVSPSPTTPRTLSPTPSSSSPLSTSASQLPQLLRTDSSSSCYHGWQGDGGCPLCNGSFTLKKIDQLTPKTKQS